MSGDLNQQLQGRVDARVTHFEMSQTTEDLQKQIEEEHENSKKLQENAEFLRLQNELEAEKMKQKKWQEAINQLQEAKEHAQAEHEEYLGKLKSMSSTTKEDTSKSILEWFQTQTAELNRGRRCQKEEGTRNQGSRNKRAHGTTRGHQ